MDLVSYLIIYWFDIILDLL